MEGIQFCENRERIWRNGCDGVVGEILVVILSGNIERIEDG